MGSKLIQQSKTLFYISKNIMFFQISLFQFPSPTRKNPHSYITTLNWVWCSRHAIITRAFPRRWRPCICSSYTYYSIFAAYFQRARFLISLSFFFLYTRLINANRFNWITMKTKTYALYTGMSIFNIKTNFPYKMFNLKYYF